MKNFVKLFVVALAVALVASLFAFSASAAEEIPNPNDLQPGSDTVIFIKDAPRDENNEISGDLEGDGSGFDANNPFKPSDTHEQFEPAAERKRWHVLTAIYQAIELLKEEKGGTIVICGPVYIGINEVGDNGASSVRDMETVRFDNRVIKFTSVYNGVDYRKEAGAKLTISYPAMLNVRGSTIWENIDIETVGPDRGICFGEWPTLVGEGVNCYPADPTYEGVPEYYVSLAGGDRYNYSTDKTPNLLVKSGTYYNIVAGMWGAAASNAMNNCNTYLTIEGTTKVLGTISGTVLAKSGYSGNVNITINGGTFECDINGVGPTGLLNTDGVVNIKINGGDFENVWSINQSAMGATNNMPAVCTLDFSGWTGDKLGLAHAYGAVTDITNIKYPEGVTKEMLEEELENFVPETTVPEETDPVTPAETKDSVKETEKQPEATKKPASQTPTTPTEPGDDEGSNLGLIIGIIAAVVVVVAAVVVVIVMKKKKAAK